jgi:hypothetical protein
MSTAKFKDKEVKSDGEEVDTSESNTFSWLVPWHLLGDVEIPART